MLLLYGCRRVGKTELFKHWAEQNGLPFTYWAAAIELSAREGLVIDVAALDEGLSGDQGKTGACL